MIRNGCKCRTCFHSVSGGPCGNEKNKWKTHVEKSKELYSQSEIAEMWHKRNMRNLKQ